MEGFSCIIDRSRYSTKEGFKGGGDIFVHHQGLFFKNIPRRGCRGFSLLPRPSGGEGVFSRGPWGRRRAAARLPPRGMGQGFWWWRGVRGQCGTGAGSPANGPTRFAKERYWLQKGGGFKMLGVGGTDMIEGRKTGNAAQRSGNLFGDGSEFVCNDPE